MKKVSLITIIATLLLFAFTGVCSAENICGFTKDVKSYNSKTPVLLAKWVDSNGTEFQEFGYLRKTWVSFFIDDQPFNHIYTFSKSQLPTSITVNTSQGVARSVSATVSGSLSVGYGPISGQVTSSASVSNEGQINQGESTPFIIPKNSPGMWRVAGFFCDNTYQYAAKTLMWDKAKNKFVVYRDGYTVTVNVPFCYTITSQYIRKINM